jgi:hypothetical protein
MGEAKRKREYGIQETHEPHSPQNWPHGHVHVEVTGDETVECFVVTVHTVKHYLHASTARELQKMLQVALDQFNRDVMVWNLAMGERVPLV